MIIHIVYQSLSTLTFFSEEKLEMGLVFLFVVDPSQWGGASDKHTIPVVKS